jgi:uncharacterized membrane protein
MKIIGFLVFIVGCCLQSFWIAAIGFVLYEVNCKTWVAMAFMRHGSGHDDQGPMN